MHLTIGIDIGTSSVRVAAFPTGSWDFQSETLASRSMPVSRDTAGGETAGGRYRCDGRLPRESAKWQLY